MNWSLNLISIGIFNGLMLSILFLRKKDHNFYFGFFLLAHSFILVKYINNAIEFSPDFRYFIHAAEILEWLVGPFLYFYVMKFSSLHIRYKFIHFLPALIYALILLPIYLIVSSNTEMEWFQIYETRFNFLTVPKILLGLFYVSLSLRRVKNERWVILILSVYFSEILALSLYYFQGLFFDKYIISALLVSSVMTFAVNIIAISGMMKSSIFTREIKSKESSNLSHVNLETLEKIFEKVRLYVEQEEAYKNPQLRLLELSKEIGFSEKQISQSVNECAKENISSFINRYRIRLAEKLLIDNKYNHYTIDAIAEECGFSNKVSFYKAFKKIHQLSPKEFKNRITANIR